MNAHARLTFAARKIQRQRSDRTAPACANSITLRHAQIGQYICCATGIHEQCGPEIAEPMGIFGAACRHDPSADHRIAFNDAQALICKTAHGLRTADAEQVVLRYANTGGSGSVTALDACLLYTSDAADE